MDIYIFFPFTDQASVTINVIDINDNSPIFAENMYEKSVPENLPVGSEVIIVTATDVDSGTEPSLSESTL